MADKKYVFEPMADITVFELIGALQLEIEYSADSLRKLVERLIDDGIDPAPVVRHFRERRETTGSAP